MAGDTSGTSSTVARAVKLRAVAKVHEKANGEDGEVAELTAVMKEWTAQSGTS